MSSFFKKINSLLYWKSQSQASPCSQELTFLFHMKLDGKPRNLGSGNMTVMCNVSVHFGMVLHHGGYLNLEKSCFCVCTMGKLVSETIKIDF